MTEAPGAHGRLLAQLERRAGLRIDRGHEQRLARVLGQVAPEGGWRERFGSDAAFRSAVIDAVAIDESYFFRHHAQLEYLRDVVLPGLVAERPAGHRLQLWSAGCADGEEPYTLAVLLAEAGVADRADVLGTDVSPAAVERGRTARYSRWALRSRRAQDRSHLFDPDGGRFRLRAEVVASVDLRTHNLMDLPYPAPTAAPGFDVVLCRNVLLHLTPDALAVVVPRLVAALAAGGWLFTAPADPSPVAVPGTGPLDAVVLPTGGVVYRRPDTAPTARVPVATPFPVAAPPRPHPRRRRRRSVAARVATPRPAASMPPPPAADEDGPARCARARALLAAGRPAEALGHAMAAAFLSPDLAPAHLTLGLAAAATGRHAVAGRAFRRAAELFDAMAGDDVVELAEGETAGALADLARAHALLHLEGAT
jgi:chemotaxis protein methyltransferase CheR